MPCDSLPIDAVLPEFCARLAEHGAVVLQAPTGAGKTTRVPPAILDTAGEIILLEPRRVAARAAARRMAFEDGTVLGDRIGYHVRFDRRISRTTRIIAMTPGILLRRLQDDPYLETVSAVVFDEFHERGLESDLVLGLVRMIRMTVRPELRIVVMSATLDVSALSAYLGGPVVASEGRSYPVAIRYQPRRGDMPIADAVATAIRTLASETAGGILTFLPGVREIRHTAERLDGIAADVMLLHGDLPPDEQDRALQAGSRRKIVLATNIAETSVTVEGITAVIDSGLARIMQYDASVGLDRLQLEPISRASADQRAGRAGRTQPGLCVRLWDESSHRGRPSRFRKSSGSISQVLSCIFTGWANPMPAISHGSTLQGPRWSRMPSRC
jgi:ATP-dependent helicase HrpB